MMSFTLFKDALIRIARIHVNEQLFQAKKDLLEIDEKERDRKVAGLHSIAEVEEEETPMPQIPQSKEQLDLELMLVELESVEHNIKNMSEEKKDVLDFIDNLNE